MRESGLRKQMASEVDLRGFPSNPPGRQEGCRMARVRWEPSLARGQVYADSHPIHGSKGTMGLGFGNGMETWL